MGGSNTKTVGGGPATGLADEFTQWLQEGLVTGQFGGASPGSSVSGADPYASTRNKVNDAIAGGGWQGKLASKAAGKIPPPPSANPTAGFSGVINDILSGGAGKVGRALKQLLETQQAGDVGNLRSRYSMGGTGAGTPSAYAESLYRANAAPQAAMQIGELQLQTLMPLLQMIAAMAGKGIPQASTLVEPSFLSQLGSLAGGAGGLLTGVGAL